MGRGALPSSHRRVVDDASITWCGIFDGRRPDRGKISLAKAGAHDLPGLLYRLATTTMPVRCSIYMKQSLSFTMSADDARSTVAKLLGAKVRCTLEDGRVVDGTLLCVDRLYVGYNWIIS